MADGSALIGGFASLAIVFLWLITFHKKFFESILKTNKHNAYGTYTTFWEAMTTHFWFLVKGLFITPDREALEAQVKQTFLKQIGQEAKDPDDTRNVLLTHSCRSLFYYIIKTCLDNAKEKTGKAHIKIALPAVHFGSFYRLLRGIEKSTDCKIDFYEIDLKEDDWTLDQESIVEDEVKKCDLVLCQHLFGVPFHQDRLFEMGKKLGIPILEDCVQSGSMFGKYKGNPLSDVIIYSGGLDKTPQCFGAGMGFFRNTPNGNALFEQCSAYHNSLPLDTWKKRFVGCFNQLLHLIIAQNLFYFNNFLGLIAYVWLSERGDYIKWYAMSLKVRKSKSFTPFQHAESGFLRRPSPYHLQSMMHGLVTKKHQYPKIAQEELDRRELLLSNIPKQYHCKLFPWYTTKLLQEHRDNFGIQEFSWVASPTSEERMDLMIHLNDNFMIPMINTTWEFHEFTKLPVSKDMNNRLVYLPNMAHNSKEEILHVSKTLTRYCEMLEGGATGSSKPKQS